jgi:hypothetical protein
MAKNNLNNTDDTLEELEDEELKEMGEDIGKPVNAEEAAYSEFEDESEEKSGPELEL